MRENFEKNHFLVLYAMICKYKKNRLPSDLVLEIKHKCDKVRKELRLEHNRRYFAIGTSKFAAKRRAHRMERCFKCGKFTHDGACSKNQTTSNNEFLTLCREGPVRCYMEKLLNPRGYAYANMHSEIARLTIRARELGLE